MISSVSLTHEFENFGGGHVASRPYRSAGELVRAALRRRSAEQRGGDPPARPVQTARRGQSREA
jgi:Arc/MetJ-type ribon-helix-helix transcriptional regulator